MDPNFVTWGGDSEAPAPHVEPACPFCNDGPCVGTDSTHTEEKP